MASRTSPTFRRKKLARQLRALREGAGMKLAAAASDLYLSTSRLSRIEHAEVIVDVFLVRAMLDLYQVHDEDQRADLLDLAVEARKKGWWHPYGLGKGGYVALETEACAIRDYSITFVPGLMQTADYCRALFQCAPQPKPSAEIEKIVAARIMRQDRLTDDEPLRLTCVIDESALLRPVGGPKVLRAQIARILQVAELPTVSIQIIPMQFGAHFGMNGPVTILSFPEPEDPDIAYLENGFGSLHIENPDEVKEHIVMFDHLSSIALSNGASAALMRDAIDAL